MIDGKYFFYQPLKDDKVTYENIRKVSTGQVDDYTTGCLLDYPYFKDNYKMIALELSKQQMLSGNPRANHQISFTAILNRNDENAYTRIYFILEEARATKLYFSQETVKVL